MICTSLIILLGALVQMGATNGTTGGDQLGEIEGLYRNLTTVYHDYMRRRRFVLDSTTWNRWTKPQEVPPKKTAPYYDFIIVGSGSAGSVIANRLSEIPQWNILLLEAGNGENLVSRIPIVAPALQFTQYNWGHFMEYQPNMCTGLEQQRMHWPRGKALGGTSVINYMIYTRGNRLDYDRWAQQGNPGWSYREVLPYFIKSERSGLNNGDPEIHGLEGPLSVEDIYQSKLVEAFVEGGQELGLPHIDYNANRVSFGVGTVQATVLKGRRHSHARAFLQPYRKYRPNLHIVTGAHVTRVLIDGTTREAFGVEYKRRGGTYRVLSKREVVLSAGAYNSPQLLMLSGIGPRDHLTEIGIKTLSDLPVGQNLHDHLTFVGLSFLINHPWSLSADKLLSRAGIFGYFGNGTGPATSLGGVEGIGYIKTPLSQDPDDVPDIELIFVGGTLSTDYGIITRRGMNIRDDVYDQLFRPTHNVPQWTIFPMLLHPKSTGYLRLRSKDPFDYPRLYGNYFTDPEQQDINTLVASIRFIQQLSNTKTFRRVGSTLNPNHHPGCEAFRFDSDDYWRCALRSMSVTLHHQVGTCKMGPPDDPGAVVNADLKVYGVDRLRVADTSVIPFALGAHTNAPTTMVGEKAADIIKKAWGVL